MVEFINVVELVSGGTGAATGAFCGFPLDTVKVYPFIPSKDHLLGSTSMSKLE